MGKYLKKFNSHAEYNAFTATTAFILPNVSLCVNEDDLHYNPLVRVSGVTLDKSELSIKEGDTETLVASVLPYNASNKNVTWSSSDDSVATVDNGVVSGVAVGNTNITVTTEDGGYTAQCATSVKSYKVITYTATAKLNETTSSYSNGLHINSFSGTSGQQLTMVSHTFEDGVGTVTFNGDIAKFGDFAFYNCGGLTSINIPSSVTSIGNSAFYYCTSLTSINIPDGVTSIGNSAFQLCVGLTSINIPSGVTSIGNQVFRECNSLTSIDIPSGVTTIGSNAFYYCTSLTSINIPDGVTSIGNSAFQNCSGLTSIDIPDSVTSIGSSAFTNCRRFTSIVIPDNVRRIDDRVFDCCYSLTSCTIGSGVTSIGVFAFNGCTGLTSVNIPSGVTSISDGGFRLCQSLTSFTCNAITPPILGGSEVFLYVGCPIYVPSASVDTYKASSGWSDYASRIQAIP